MLEKILRVGIAGYGVVGKRRRHFIDKHIHLKTVAVCDRSFNSEGNFVDGVHFYKDFEQLIENEKLDILFVCMPNDISPFATIAGLKNSLHVFCEKPPGRDVKDIKSVIEIEKQFSHLKLMYGFNHRYHDSVKEALRIMRSKELGAVLNLRAVYGKSKILSFDSDWRTKRVISGGGILLDQGIHMVDLLRLFAGDFIQVNSFISNNYWNHDVEDNAYAIMKTDTNIVAMLHSSATQWRHKFQLEITLERGQLILSGILSGTKSYGAEMLTVVYANEHDGGDPKEVTIRYNNDPSWQAEIFEFADSILYNKPVTSGSSAEALKTMELVYKIYCADKEWKEKYNLSLD